ncbi:4-hydroxybutyrate CoA-transferase [Shewanella sp. OPT22]|nr:4-hydroxybutyrate CoA-transferase [Shewanella sp. OPT22]
MNYRFGSKEIQQLYQAKLTSPEDAIKQHLHDAELLTFGCYAATPVALTKALTQAAKSGFLTKPVKAFLFRSAAEIISMYRDVDVLKHIHLILPFIGSEIGKLFELAKKHRNEIQYPEYTPSHFSLMEKGLLSHYGVPDVHMFQVSKMDKHGYFSFGLDGSFSIPMSQCAKQVIVEENPNFPFTYGAGLIHISDVAGIVSHKSDLLTLPTKPASSVDKDIANYILPFIHDNSCIQLGIGGVPNAVGEELKDKNDLGIHTELLSDSQLKLIMNGNVTNKYKQINRYHTVFNITMMPDQTLYDAMDANPTILCYPASYVNDPNTIAKNDNMVSVNSFVEIDLFGQVSSESIAWHQITGTGGQVDFVRGARASKNGKSFLAAHSTVKGGSISKIVPKLNNIVTTARTDVQYVVTEHGCANLEGLSNHERAQALIRLAAPEFREQLIFEAKTMGLLA